MSKRIQRLLFFILTVTLDYWEWVWGTLLTVVKDKKLTFVKKNRIANFQSKHMPY